MCICEAGERVNKCRKGGSSSLEFRCGARYNHFPRNNSAERHVRPLATIAPALESINFSFVAIIARVPRAMQIVSREVEEEKRDVPRRRRCESP